MEGVLNPHNPFTTVMQISYWFFQFATVLIHGIAFLWVFRDHYFDKKVAVRGCHTHTLYSVDSHARRGHATSRVWLDVVIRRIILYFSELNCSFPRLE